MPDTVQRLDIVHEATFGQPAFALLREFPSVIKAFYEVLSTRFPLNAEHISITPTSTVSELLIRIGLFNNVASVELKLNHIQHRLAMNEFFTRMDSDDQLYFRSARKILQSSLQPIFHGLSKNFPPKR